MDAPEILRKMNALLKEILSNAQELEKLSSKVISEKEVIPLQQKQELLINELTKLDANLQKEFPQALTKDSKEKQAIHEKLREFQKLNRKFIENLKLSPGLIQFKPDEEA